MKIDFQKWHGCRNDFIVIEYDKFEGLANVQKHAQEICQRDGSGIGADGILAIKPQDKYADLTIINSDGSLAANCGNGLRCAAAYYHQKSGAQQISFKVMKDTITVSKVGDLYAVDMPKFKSFDENHKRLIQNECDFEILDEQFVDLGNPHLILPPQKMASWEFFKFAQKIQSVQGGINIHLIENIDQSNPPKLKVLVYERGAGATKACGTGACAVAKWYQHSHPELSDFNIEMPGGTLGISINADQSTLKGPAHFVFSGTLNI